MPTRTLKRGVDALLTWAKPRLHRQLSRAAIRLQEAGPQVSEADIFYCYRLILGRTPDPEGWRTFVAARHGFALPDLVAVFLTSPEFKGRPIFQKMLSRRPEETPTLVELDGYKQYVSPEDFEISRSILTEKCYEPHVTRVMAPLLVPGATFLDVGANIGYFTLLAAHRVGPTGRVLAFEPNPYNCSLLYLSAQANGFEQIELFPFAVADQETTFAFDNVGGSNGVITPVDGMAAEALFHRTLVRSIRLDRQFPALDRLDVIKMDIEGAEYRALQGAEALIRQHQPILFSEFSPGGLQHVSGVSGQTYLEALRGHGYHLALLERDGRMSEHGSDVAALLRQIEASPFDHADIVAYPPAKREQLFAVATQATPTA